MGLRDLNLRLSFLDNFSARFRQTMANASRSISDVQERLTKASRPFSDFGHSAKGIGMNIADMLSKPISSAMEFETAMADVRKAVNALDTEEKFQQMQQSVLELGRTLPLVHTEIAAIVAAGGRMGVPHAELLTFTKDVAKMASAFDMSAGEVGESMGKIATVFSIPYSDLAKLGDVINHIADNTSSKEPQIIEAMQRVAGTANQVGLKADQTAAIVASFIHLGKGPETAASAVNALLREMVTAEGGTKKFQGALKQLGLDGKKLQRDMVATPQETLIDVMERIMKVPKHMQTTIATDLFGKEFGDDAALLSTKMDEYKKILNLSKDKEGQGSLDKSLEILTATSAAKMTMVKNQINEVMVAIGNELLPIIGKLVQDIKPFITDLVNWIKNNKELTLTILKMVAGAAALSMAIAAISFLIGGVIKTISGALGVVKAFGSAFSFISSVVQKLGVLRKVVSTLFTVLRVGFAALRVAVLTNPILAVLTGIAVAAYLIYSNWDSIVAFFKEKFGGLYKAFSGFAEFLKNNFVNSLRYIGYKIWNFVFFPIIKGLEIIQSGLNALGMDVSMPSLKAENLFGEIDWVPNKVDTSGFAETPAIKFMKSIRPKDNPTPFQIAYTPTINITGNPSPDQLQEINKTVKSSGQDLFKTMKQQEQREKEKQY